MNRIKISPLASISPESTQATKTVAKSLDQIEKIAARTSSDFSLFVPMHYEKNYAYPLIVWLHSNGHSSAQLQKIMPETSIRNYVGIAPQGSEGNDHSGYEWKQSVGGIDEAYESIMAAVDHACIRFNIAQDKIFLAGFGAGGEMAFRIAFRRPEIFAGVISVNGQLPSNETVLRDFSRCRDLPVYWAHYRKSIDFLQDDLCDQLRLLHVAGFSVTLRQYPCGDELSPSTFADVNDWIMDVIEANTDATIIR